MAAIQSSKSQAKEDQSSTKFEKRMGDEIEPINIDGISLEDIEELSNGFKIEIQRLGSEKATILSVKILDSIKNQYQMLRYYKLLPN